MRREVFGTLVAGALVGCVDNTSGPSSVDDYLEEAEAKRKAGRVLTEVEREINDAVFNKLLVHAAECAHMPTNFISDVVIPWSSIRRWEEAIKDSLNLWAKYPNWFFGGVPEEAKCINTASVRCGALYQDEPNRFMVTYGNINVEKHEPESFLLGVDSEGAKPQRNQEWRLFRCSYE